KKAPCGHQSQRRERCVHDSEIGVPVQFAAVGGPRSREGDQPARIPSSPAEKVVIRITVRSPLPHLREGEEVRRSSETSEQAGDSYSQTEMQASPPGSFTPKSVKGAVHPPGEGAYENDL